jgi:hypothetical protein
MNWPIVVVTPEDGTLSLSPNRFCIPWTRESLHAINRTIDPTTLLHYATCLSLGLTFRSLSIDTRARSISKESETACVDNRAVRGHIIYKYAVIKRIVFPVNTMSVELWFYFNGSETRELNLRISWVSLLKSQHFLTLIYYNFLFPFIFLFLPTTIVPMKLSRQNISPFLKIAY